MIIELTSPYPLYGLPALWRWINASRDRIADDFFPKDLDAFVDQWILIEEAGRRSWGVWRDGELGGVVTSSRTGAISCDLHCIFARHFWGHDLTLESIRRVCGELFSGTPGNEYEKIATMAFADNRNLSAIVRLLGGSREGLLRRHTRRGGRLVDLIILGLEKERFNVSRSGIQSSERVEQLDARTVDQSTVQPVLDDQRLRIDQRIDQRNGQRSPGIVSGATGRANLAGENHQLHLSQPRAVPGTRAESSA